MILVPDPHDRDGELTLVVALDAARAFADPGAVVEDARRWSRYVGVVDNDVEAVAAFLADHGVENDFALGDRDKWRAMADIKAAANTPRYVFVGASPEDRRLAKHVGWEFLTSNEAAEKAGWTLSGPAEAGRNGDRGDGSDAGVLDRLRRSLWPF
ncbi:hypothetical protein [Halorubrum sp. JWXQ-INN 858]|uniref:DUF7124 domain-containing protein n=1 Tax=Halorubrum sp. JWXQ-INN 858 TaxID=2690782 RepID=UPI002AA2A428|nr:hypothetical protein [Halorubrum sp. JWXQ-INN 858]